MKHLQLQLKMDTFSAFKVKGASSPESKYFDSRVIPLGFFCDVRCVCYTGRNQIFQFVSKHK